MNQVSFEEITAFQTLYKAYRKAKAGKGYNQSRLRFEQSALDGIVQLQKMLQDKSFSVSPYNKFTIYEPKERVVEAGSFKDKIVQHSICDNALVPLLEEEFIETNVAGQRNKGTLCGLDYLKNHMLSAYEKYGYDCWIIKADITKFFYRIQHPILKDIVQYFVEDKNLWWLCETFIDSTNGDGLPLGNQITQVFAILFLSGLDHFVTGELGIEYYGRYMDDFYMIVQNRSYAVHCLCAVREFVGTLGLELNGKTQIIPFKNGLRYCGFHTYVTEKGVCIRKLTNDKKRAAKKRYKRMVKLVVKGKLSMEDFNESYVAFKNHISNGNCVKFGYELDRMIGDILSENNLHKERVIN